uniref:NDRG family member 2 n=1 Tax=Cyprinus carpio TaxID=7962 RepID=A0A8C2A333_CYPCA
PGEIDMIHIADRFTDGLDLAQDEHRVETPHGVLHVTVHGAGNARRPAILTFHDVGMDSKSCFSTLFKFEEMQEIVKNFTVVHVDAPGQEDGAAIYPAGYQYASMDQVSEMLPAVLQYFNFRTIIGVGVGAGAYILSKFTLSNPDAVEGLVLINVDTNARGWMDWAAQKLSNLTSSLPDQILSHLFSQEEMSANTELIQTHRERISKAPNLINIELFWKSYQGRRDLNIERNNTFKCPVMLVVGDQAPYEEAAVECNSKLDPTTTSFLKMADAGGMPQLTQPSKLTEAFKYFIQGMGYSKRFLFSLLTKSVPVASYNSDCTSDGRWSILTMTFIPFMDLDTVNLFGRLWDSLKPPGFHPKYLKLCSEEERSFFTGLEVHGGK